MARVPDPAGEPRPDVSSPGGNGLLRALIGLCAVLSLVYGVFGAFADAEREGEFLWDLDFYRQAAARWSTGQDPYVSDGEATGYYYSLTITPLLARLLRDFEAERLYAALMAVALLAALALAVRGARPPPGTLLLCCLYAAAFGNGEVVYVLASGNLAWLSGLLLAGALAAAARDRWPLFYLVVGIASLIKPYSLLLLCVPLALGTLSPLTAIALVPWLVDLSLSWLLWPDLAASRLSAFWLGIIEPLQLRYSLAGRLSRVLADQGGLAVGTATLLAVSAQLGIGLTLALLVRSRSPAQRQRALALAIVAAFATFPRMAGYDAFVFGPAVFAAFLPGDDSGLSKTAAAAFMLPLLAGMLKEGLAVLPLLALPVVLLISARWQKEGLAPRRA